MLMALIRWLKAWNDRRKYYRGYRKAFERAAKIRQGR